MEGGGLLEDIGEEIGVLQALGVMKSVGDSNGGETFLQKAAPEGAHKVRIEGEGSNVVEMEIEWNPRGGTKEGVGQLRFQGPEIVKGEALALEETVANPILEPFAEPADVLPGCPLGRAKYDIAAAMTERDGKEAGPAVGKKMLERQGGSGQFNFHW